MRLTDPCQTSCRLSSVWQRRRAFSLVEVTLALGITVFAILPILVLLPLGLTSMQESRADFVGAQIRQEMEGDLAITAFGENPPTSYFDYAGLPTDQANAHYTVTFPAAGQAVFPGSENSTTISTVLRKVTLRVESQSGSVVTTKNVYQLNTGR